MTFKLFIEANWSQNCVKIMKQVTFFYMEDLVEHQNTQGESNFPRQLWCWADSSYLLQVQGRVLDLWVELSSPGPGGRQPPRYFCSILSLSATCLQRAEGCGLEAEWTSQTPWLTPSPCRSVRLHHWWRRVITAAETIQRLQCNSHRCTTEQFEECRVSFGFAGCRLGSSGHR